MIADLFKSILDTFADPAVEMWLKGFLALVLLLLSGFAWMVLKRLLSVLVKPWRWYQERQAWRAVADREGWVTAATRKFSALHDGQPWRMRGHVQGAWISDDDNESSPPTQAQWQMKDAAWSGRVVVIPRALDEAAQKRAAESSGAGDAANLVLAAAGIVGVLTGQSWGSAALGWAGSSEADESIAIGLDVVQIGSAGFQSGYVVRTDNPDVAHRMFTPDVESMLDALRNGADPENAFMAELANGRFSMRYLGNFSNAERAAQFCKLGLAVTRGVSVNPVEPDQGTVNAGDAS